MLKDTTIRVSRIAGDEVAFAKYGVIIEAAIEVEDFVTKQDSCHSSSAIREPDMILVGNISYRNTSLQNYRREVTA